MLGREDSCIDDLLDLRCVLVDLLLETLAGAPVVLDQVLEDSQSYVSLHLRPSLFSFLCIKFGNECGSCCMLWQYTKRRAL